MSRHSRVAVADDAFHHGKRRIAFAAETNKRVPERMKADFDNGSLPVFAGPGLVGLDSALGEMALNHVRDEINPAAVKCGGVGQDVFTALLSWRFGQQVGQDGVNRDNYGLGVASGSLIGDAPNQAARQIHFAPAQRGAIAQPKTRVNAQGKKRTQFPTCRLTEFFQFSNRQLAPTVRDDPLALNVLPWIARELRLVLQDTEYKRQKVQVLVKRRGA